MPYLEAVACKVGFMSAATSRTLLSDVNAHTFMSWKKTVEDRVAAVSSPELERRHLEIIDHAMNDRRSKAGKT